jgi:hypothetical protein
MQDQALGPKAEQPIVTQIFKVKCAIEIAFKAKDPSFLLFFQAMIGDSLA